MTSDKTREGSPLLPPRRAGFRLALRLAGMTTVWGRYVSHSRESGNPDGLYRKGTLLVAKAHWIRARVTTAA